jgi:polysaccharide export outer membrane protein
MKLTINKTWLLWGFLTLLFSPAAGEPREYVMGPEDELEITFWQEQQLNSVVRVGQDGRIVIPVVGSITAAGLTPTELGRIIVDKISIFNKGITQASVVVTRYGSNKIYLTGEVRTPGKLSFEVIPNLWDAILEAGGPTEEAALNNVTIIRGGFEKDKKIVVDLTKFLDNGEIVKLPPLYKGDTVFIPALPGARANIRSASPLGQQNTVYIYGAVRNPGNYMFSTNMTLFQVLGLAGGITELAELKDVRVISLNEGMPVITLLDLSDNHRIARSKPFQLNPNDTIIIPSRETRENRGFGQFFYELLTTGVTAAITVLLYQLF